MAEQGSSAVGHYVNADTELGASMHGVTGYEPSYWAKAGPNELDEVAVDRKGRPFSLPVDALHRAKTFSWKLKQPHMPAFWLSTFCLFCTFFGTFAPAALITIIREDLNLTASQVGAAGITSVVGTVASRIIMGIVCDTFGPRLGHCVTLLATAPAVFSMAMVRTAGGFIACRFFIGVALATFVANQYWSTTMYSTNIVGLANGLSAGIGNSGGGFTHIVMSRLFETIKHAGHPDFTAWRLAFFLPGCMYIVMATLTLIFGQDTPDGSYKELKAKGQMAKSVNTKRVIYFALSNYRTWVLMLSYGFAFGIELTMDNILPQYFVDFFDMSVHRAGEIAAGKRSYGNRVNPFGIMAFGCRGLGGFISDHLAVRYGIRARILSLYTLQVLGGAFAMIMSRQKDSYPATVGTLIAFAVFTISATGALYSITPFISKRSLGVVSGFVGAGGNAGAAIIQAAFFTTPEDNGGYSTPDGIFVMGITCICCATPVLSLYWPAWGGAFLPPSKHATEEMYYLKDYTVDEIKAGDANAALKFAAETRSMRGSSHRGSRGDISATGSVANPSVRPYNRGSSYVSGGGDSAASSAHGADKPKSRFAPPPQPPIDDSPPQLIALGGRLAPEGAASEVQPASQA